MAHSRKADQYDVSTGGNSYWDMTKDFAKTGIEMIGRNLVGSNKSPRLETGSVEHMLTPIGPKRGEPPFKSLIKEPKRSVTSTATPGQQARLAAAARTGKVQSQRGVSARRNAADISMNNSPLATDATGHRYNPRTGRQLPHRH